MLPYHLKAFIFPSERVELQNVEAAMQSLESGLYQLAVYMAIPNLEYIFLMKNSLRNVVWCGIDWSPNLAFYS